MPNDSSPALNETAPRKERRFVRHLGVILSLAALTAGMEVFTRTKLFDMSKDFSRFKTYPARAERLVKQPGLRVALVGNSTTELGVDVPTLERHLASTLKQPVHVDMFVADASRVNTWYYMMKRFFWTPGNKPDLVLIHFYDNNLWDDQNQDLGRLAQFFTTSKDWPDLLEIDLKDGAKRLEFATASAWATYAARERIKERLLGYLPGHNDFLTHVNGVNRAHTLKQEGKDPVSQPDPSYRALERLNRTANANGTPLCYIAFPTQKFDKKTPYDLDVRTVRQMKESKIPFFDLRNAPELTVAHYADEIHLNDAGRKLYTPRVAKAVAPLLSRSEGQKKLAAFRSP